MSNHLKKILVATHKPYWMPTDEMYLPVQVGSAGKESIAGYQRDDEGKNISKKNPHYSELTALYWGWKNLDVTYMGLVHYRRQFGGSGERGILTGAETDALLEQAPIILPKRRKYYIETLASHYEHANQNGQLLVLREAIATVDSHFLVPFDNHMRERNGHMFNMMVMRKDLLDAYCEWMFAVLAEAEQHIDFSSLTDFDARLLGRYSEFLLDVWISVTDNSYVECPLVDMEPVNWVKKGSSFLAAKFLGKKYGKSF